MSPSVLFTRGVSAIRNRILFDYYLTRSGFSLWPRKIVLEITHRCNLRCFMCSLYGTKDSGSIRAQQFERQDVMTFEERKAFIRQIAKFRPLIAFSGGEPLLYRHCFDLVEYIKKQNLTCIIITNGTMLSRHAERAVSSGVDAVAVSLDGPEPIHDSIRGVPGTFAKACEGIRKLRHARANRRSERPTIKVTFCITNRNHSVLREFVDIAADLGVDELTFSHLWFTTPEAAREHNRRFPDCGKAFPENLMAMPGIDVEGLVAQIEGIRAMSLPFRVGFMPDLNADQIRSYYREPERLVKAKHCSYPWLVVRVLPNGDIIPCLSLVIGNARNERFWAVWNGEKMRRFRCALQAANAFPVCTRCCGMFEHVG